MTPHILRDIAVFIQNAKFFPLMANEFTDVSNKEQVVEYPFDLLVID